LPQRDPVLRGGLPRRLHEGEFTLHLYRTLRLGPFADGLGHPVRHDFDLLVLVDGGFYPVGFEMGIKGVDVLFHDGRPLLVGIVRAS
jgi:hypothetical protein